MTGQALSSATQQGAGTAPAPAFRLSVAPATVVVATGQRSYTEKITLTNNGSKPVMISTSAVGAGQQGAHCMTGQSQSWASVTPASWRLRPAHHHVFTLTVAAPADLSGRHSVVALFKGHLVGQAPGEVSISGALGSQVVLRLSGPTDAASACAVVLPTKPAKHQAVAVAPAASHSAAGLLGGLGGLLVLCAAVAVLVTRRARRKGTSAAPVQPNSNHRKDKPWQG